MESIKPSLDSLTSVADMPSLKNSRVSGYGVADVKRSHRIGPLARNPRGT